MIANRRRYVTNGLVTTLSKVIDPVSGRFMKLDYATEHEHVSGGCAFVDGRTQLRYRVVVCFDPF
ncbi:MAG: hypothetical protein V9F03_10385 [Microthrixaceae bacterium]